MLASDQSRKSVIQLWLARQKIKRNKIEEAYDPLLDDWYASGKKVIWQD